MGSFFEVGEVVGVSRSNFEKRHIELVQEFYSHLKDTSRQKKKTTINIHDILGYNTGAHQRKAVLSHCTATVLL